MPPLIAAVAAITLADVLATVATLAISFAANFVIGALTQAVAGGDSSATTATDSHTITVKQPLAPWQAVYGRTRVGGVYVYIHTSGPISDGDQTYANAQMTGAIVLACHQVDAIEKIYFGDEEIVIDPATGKAIGRFAMYVNIIRHLGTPTQAADQMLIDAGDGTWTAAHRLQGRAYIAFRLFYQKDLFPSMPQISALVRGKLLLDPRDSSTKWSDNAALCIFDYFRGTDGWQMAVAAAEISSPSIVAAANACDEIVATAPLSGAVTFLNGTFSAVVSKVLKRNWNAPPTTIPSAFSLTNDNLHLLTGQRIQLGGAGLPTGVAAGTDYWVIRDPDNTKLLEQLNVVPKPTIQLASSLANANAGTYVPITTPGSGTIYRLDEFWMADLGLAGLRTGDQVQIASTGTLPAPFVAATAYYWIAYGVEQVKSFDQGDAVSYGHGNLASTQQNALNGVKITIASLGSGALSLVRKYERRYTCNGVVDTQQKPLDIIGQLLSSCGGRVVNSGGVWSLFPAVWRAPSATVDESYLRAGISVQTLVSRRDLFNAVSGTFTSPAKQYQPDNFPAYPDQSRPDLDVYLAQDGGERIWSSNVALPFTNSAPTAQRLAKIMLMQVRQQISMTYPANLKAFGLAVADNIYVNNTRMGWAAKPFEIVNWSFRLDGGDGAPVPGIDLNLRETGSDVYSWDNGLELPDPASDASRLPAPTRVPTVHGVSATEEIYVTQSGAGAKSRIHVVWGPVEDGFTGRYQIAYWSSIDGIWRYPAAFPSEMGTESYLYDLPPATYIISVRAINILNVAGLWSDYFNLVTRGLVAQPHDITNFRVAAMNGHAHLTWTLSPDIDVVNGGKIWVRWTQALVNPKWEQGSMDLLITGQATEATIFLKAGTYMVKARDSSGNNSVNFAAWALPTVDMPGWTTVIHTNEAPTFPGAKTNLVVSSSTLQLATVGPGALVDAWPDVDSVASWDNEGATAPTGEYDFTSSIDLGAIFGFRMELFTDPNSVGAGDADAMVFPEISTTLDNPASGTAVWSSWQYYVIGDFVARGIKRRVKFESYVPAANIFITVLNDDVRMFQRQLSVAGFAVAATTGTRWNFNPAFYQQPIIAGNVISPVAGDLLSFTWDANARSYVQVKVLNGGVAVARSVDLVAYGVGIQS